MVVQEIALDILELMAPRQHEIAGNRSLRRVVNLTTGAAFSLWRAVPLVHVNRSPLDNVEKTADYLEQIVRHNAINYSDDDRSRAWSFGYYLSNAKYRIRELCAQPITEIWPEGRKAIGDRCLLDLIFMPRADTYDAAKEVAELIEVLRVLVGCLKLSLDERWIDQASSS